MTAKATYDYLRSYRDQFLNTAQEASMLTLPYLIRQDEASRGMRRLPTPWQSVGSKGVVTLASKLMMALLPPQTSFFKLQLDETKVTDLQPEMKSEIDLSFAKIERTLMDAIAASGDRVVIHQALKHLVVGGNALIFMGKKNLKLFPLNRFVLERDGNGNVLQIVTREKISKKIIKKIFPEYNKLEQPNSPANDVDLPADECDVYTHMKLDNNRVIWHQEINDKIVPGSMGKAPTTANPWLPLRMATSDGESYGRGRVEEFLGDLKSLEALSQAVVEGSAAAAKVVFVVSPSSTTKADTLAKAGNGAIVSGRPDDIGVVQVGKTADFRTAYEMIGQLSARISEAFLVMNVRDSERTTAEEVRMNQMELEQQLGGLFSLLTSEFLVPYLNRKMHEMQKNGEIPKLPKDIYQTSIVAGINALGRGQDRIAITEFLGTIGQTMGPEAIGKFINQDEVIKRLAAAQGIDVLNLVKSMQEVQGESKQQVAQAKQMELTKQVGQLASTPMMDPSKNPEATEMINAELKGNAPDQGQGPQEGQPGTGPDGGTVPAPNQ